MADFETGVLKYIHAKALVKASFPVDTKGNAHVKCDFCRYYDRIAKKCKIDDHVIYFPDYLSEDCQLDFEKGEENETVQRDD